MITTREFHQLQHSLGFGLITSFAFRAMYQSTAAWPTRGPIKLVAVFPPGASVDQVARILQLGYGSSGSGSLGHVRLTLLGKNGGINWAHISTRAGARLQTMPSKSTFPVHQLGVCDQAYEQGAEQCFEKSRNGKHLSPVIQWLIINSPSAANRQRRSSR